MKLTIVLAVTGVARRTVSSKPKAMLPTPDAHGEKADPAPGGLPRVMSNNQAEYVAVISALVDLRGQMEGAGKKSPNSNAVVHNDS